MSPKQQIIRIPSNLGLPFSTAVRVGQDLSLSGQIGLDPETGKLVAGGIGPETQQTMMNIKQVLESAGSSMAQLIKVSVFIKDMTEFNDMNQVYKQFFDGDDYPARSAVAVADLALGARVEIECTALVNCE
jgi:2-iminobutanoate/2-iminopropanoate deaminase